MKVENSQALVTVSAKAFCDTPLRFCDFDVKILPPSDDRLVSTLDKLFGKTEVMAYVDGNEKTCFSDSLPQGWEWIYIPRKGFLQRKAFAYADVVDIIRALRGENGCPWDRVQTHESIRSNLIEEAYELVDAIDLKDKDKMTEETGDLLLQAVFHMLIAEDAGEFDPSDMYDNLCNKLISRHTHIFGSAKAADSQEALAVWEANKLKEKHISGAAHNLQEVPVGMPSLLRAYKVQKRAAKYGMDFACYADAKERLLSEIVELEEAPAEQKESEAGDVLFSVVNLMRFVGVEPEVALNRSTEKFISRVCLVEQEVLARGKTFDDFKNNEKELWDIWEQVKRTEK